MDNNAFVQACAPYLHYLHEFTEKKKAVKGELAEIIERAGGPERVAFIGVDIVRGFCSVGPMSSPQMAAIVPAAAELLRRGHELKIKDFIFTCDTHSPESVEFKSWPVHCLKGDEESLLESALTDLEFSSLFKIVPKTSISSFVDTELIDILASKPQINTLIIMGGVTDLCLYHLAAGLRFYAASRGRDWRVILPVDCSATYNCSCEQATAAGIAPHDELLLNAVFLEHMQTLGCELVGHIE